MILRHTDTCVSQPSCTWLHKAGLSFPFWFLQKLFMTSEMPALKLTSPRRTCHDLRQPRKEISWRGSCCLVLPQCAVVVGSQQFFYFYKYDAFGPDPTCSSKFLTWFDGTSIGCRHGLKNPGVWKVVCFWPESPMFLSQNGCSWNCHPQKSNL